MIRKHPLTPEERQAKDEQKKREEDEAYMRGRPNRMEVANYVNALLEEKYIPEIKKLQQSIQLGIMVTQAILIQKNICTGEEIKAITKEFIKTQEQQLKADIQKHTEKIKSEVN